MKKSKQNLAIAVVDLVHAVVFFMKGDLLYVDNNYRGRILRTLIFDKSVPMGEKSHKMLQLGAAG